MAEANKMPGRGPGGPGGPGARGGYQKPKDAKRTMLRLMKYISGRKWLLVIVFLCVIASSIASIAGTYLIRPVLNELVGAGTLSDKLGYLAKMLAVMAAVEPLPLVPAMWTNCS